MEQHKKCGNNEAFGSVNMRRTYRVSSQVQIYQDITEWFQIQKVVRQGCILSPGLLNLYSEYIIKTGGVANMVQVSEK